MSATASTGTPISTSTTPGRTSTTGENRARDADCKVAMQNLKEARPATNRANDVFADRDGNVARNGPDQWETRENGQWKPVNLSTENRERATAAAQNVSPDTRERASSAAQNVTPETRERASSAVAERPAAQSASSQVSNRLTSIVLTRLDSAAPRGRCRGRRPCGPRADASGRRAGRKRPVRRFSGRFPRR